MKFAILSALAAASSALAGRIYSPASGANLTRGQSFNFTYDTGRYFKETGVDVSVILATTSAWTQNVGHDGSVIIQNWPTNKTFLPYSSNGISVDLPVHTLYTENYNATPYTLVVFERYDSYGGGLAQAFYTQNVTVSGDYGS